MRVIRPIERRDQEDFEKLAFAASLGITSLPKDPELLQKKIEHSLASFQSPETSNPLFVFVLEDLETREIGGTCAIKQRGGSGDPACSFQIREIKKTSQLPQVPSSMQVLEPLVDTNIVTEIGGLYLFPRFRKNSYGRLLSLSRFLFIANFPSLFCETIMAEMRGSIEQETTLFWECIGRHFFDVPFKEFLYQVTHHKEIVSEILPKFPLYVALLPEHVKSLVGREHPNTKPALAMLKEEGFQVSDRIDISDAGPILFGKREEIRTIAKSVVAKVEEIVPDEDESNPYIISNTKKNFRACFGAIKMSSSGVGLSAKIASALQVQKGDSIRYISSQSVSRHEHT